MVSHFAIKRLQAEKAVAPEITGQNVRKKTLSSFEIFTHCREIIRELDADLLRMPQRKGLKPILGEEEIRRMSLRLEKEPLLISRVDQENIISQVMDES